MFSHILSISWLSENLSFMLKHSIRETYLENLLQEKQHVERCTSVPL
jgi:hypothetical protein